MDGGKTSFLNGVLQDGFAREDPTLLICCEEGTEEYDPKALLILLGHVVEVEPRPVLPRNNAFGPEDHAAFSLIQLGQDVLQPCFGKG